MGHGHGVVGGGLNFNPTKISIALAGGHEDAL